MQRYVLKTSLPARSVVPRKGLMRSGPANILAIAFYAIPPPVVVICPLEPLWWVVRCVTTAHLSGLTCSLCCSALLEIT